MLEMYTIKAFIKTQDIVFRDNIGETPTEQNEAEKPFPFINLFL